MTLSAKGCPKLINLLIRTNKINPDLDWSALRLRKFEFVTSMIGSKFKNQKAEFPFKGLVTESLNQFVLC